MDGSREGKFTTETRRHGEEREEEVTADQRGCTQIWKTGFV
jgi:hypothetical protein